MAFASGGQRSIQLSYERNVLLRPVEPCPEEDSNLHAVSGTRSLVWPVYQFQHLGDPTSPRHAPERTRTSTGLRPLDPESSASTSSATGAG